MPKLGPAQMEARKRLVEDAALSLFKQRGFHGVGLREIAREAELSLGNIYNYYPTKDALWGSILDRLHGEFEADDSPLAGYFHSCAFPDDLEAFGTAVGKMVAAHADYLTLIYVDIAEFGGAHDLYNILCSGAYGVSALPVTLYGSSISPWLHGLWWGRPTARWQSGCWHFFDSFHFLFSGRLLAH